MNVDETALYAAANRVFNRAGVSREDRATLTAYFVYVQKTILESAEFIEALLTVGQALLDAPTAAAQANARAVFAHIIAATGDVETVVVQVATYS